MPSFSELATVAGTGESGRQAVKAALEGKTFKNNDELLVNTWLVHQFMLGDAQRGDSKPVPGAEEGATWVTWHGNLSDAMADLQLDGTRQGAAYEDVKRSRQDISACLRRYGNAVCLLRAGRSGRRQGRSVWMVRTDFRERVAPEDIPALRMYMTSDKKIVMHDVKPVTSPATPKTPGVKPGQQKTECKYCGRHTAPSYMTSHVFRMHANPRELISEALRQRGEIPTHDVRDLLQDIIGPGFTVKQSLVSTVLGPLNRDPNSPVNVRNGWGNAIWYWDREIAERLERERNEQQAAEAAHATDDVITSTPETEPEPEPEKKAHEQHEQHHTPPLTLSTDIQAQMITPSTNGHKNMMKRTSGSVSSLAAEITELVNRQLARADDEITALTAENERLRAENAAVSAKLATLEKWRDTIRELLGSAIPS